MDTVFIRTKAKGTEFKSDLHVFTNKWTEVPISEVSSVYVESANLEVVEDKKHVKSTEVTGEETPEADT